MRSSVRDSGAPVLSHSTASRSSGAWAVARSRGRNAIATRASSAHAPAAEASQCVAVRARRSPARQQHPRRASAVPRSPRSVMQVGDGRAVVRRTASAAQASFDPRSSRRVEHVGGAVDPRAAFCARRHDPAAGSSCAPHRPRARRGGGEGSTAAALAPTRPLVAVVHGRPALRGARRVQSGEGDYTARSMASQTWGGGERGRGVMSHSVVDTSGA